MSLFLDDGRFEIDSNTVERAIRPLALNRKERPVRRLGRRRPALGGHRLADRDCKLVGVEPHAYLTDVITRIVEGHPQRKIDDLLPWAYPPTPALRAVA